VSNGNRPGPGVLASLDDKALVTSAKAQLGALPCGKGGGFFVGNLKASTANVRVSGTDVTATHGTQLVPGASVFITADDASEIWVILETGSSGATICLTSA
jgi:hypothetical protein